MNSLTETAYLARKYINWLILGIIAYIILRILWGMLISVFLSIFPPKPPPPNHAFGILPTIQFPKQASPSAQLTFKLETIEGTVPKASESAYVYFMPKSAPDFLSLNRTQAFASKLQFSPNPVQETKNIYSFSDPKFPQRTLRYDIISHNFTISYTNFSDPLLFNSANLQLPGDLLKQSLNLLQTNNVFPQDFNSTNYSVLYLKLTDGQFTETNRVTLANAIKINLFRNSINGIKVYYPDPSTGPISIIYSSSPEFQKSIIACYYIYWPIDYQTKATYKLKTSLVAWQELNSGLAYIARMPAKGTNVTIRSIHLGYFDSVSPQTYIQPIFVFEGDEGFVAYISAIDPIWVEK
jgi:hypothetical protein